MFIVYVDIDSIVLILICSSLTSRELVFSEKCLEMRKRYVCLYRICHAMLCNWQLLKGILACVINMVYMVEPELAYK